MLIFFKLYVQNFEWKIFNLLSEQNIATILKLLLFSYPEWAQ